MQKQHFYPFSHGANKSLTAQKVKVSNELSYIAIVSTKLHEFEHMHKMKN